VFSILTCAGGQRKGGGGHVASLSHHSGWVESLDVREDGRVLVSGCVLSSLGALLKAPLMNDTLCVLSFKQCVGWVRSQQRPFVVVVTQHLCATNTDFAGHPGFFFNNNKKASSKSTTCAISLRRSRHCETIRVTFGPSSGDPIGHRPLRCVPVYSVLRARGVFVPLHLLCRFPSPQPLTDWVRFG
jgi:hypothetical protein